MRRRTASTDQELPAWYLEAIKRRNGPVAPTPADRGQTAALRKRRGRHARYMGLVALSLFAQGTQFVIDRNVWGGIGCLALAAIASWSVVAIVRRPIIDLSR